MKKEVILVPKEKCPLNVLAEMGEKTENAWIFLDASAYNKLLESDGCEVVYNTEEKIMLRWKATEEYSETEVYMGVPTSCGWGEIISIKDEGIAFTFPKADPEDIFFLKMAE